MSRRLDWRHNRPSATPAPRRWTRPPTSAEALYARIVQARLKREAAARREARR